MITPMKAVEYNTWQSFMKLLIDEVPQHLVSYRLGGLHVEVVPSYPRDLTEYHKPSIIVQKVSDDVIELGFGGFIGQHYDEDNDSLSDIIGTEHLITMQVDVAADNNSQCSMLNGLILEQVILEHKYGDNSMAIYDFTAEPTIVDGNQVYPEVGHYKFVSPFSVVYYNNQYLKMSDRDFLNHDYTGMIRFDIMTTQMKCPAQQYVDLSKGIKFSYTIIGGN